MSFLCRLTAFPVLLMLFGFMPYSIHGQKISEVNFVYQGDFQKTKYKRGGILQKYWYLLPARDTSGFAVLRAEEGGATHDVLSINYDQPPKAPGGWKALGIAVQLMGLPEAKTRISFRAHGEGKIKATVYEYKLKPSPDQRSDKTRRMVKKIFAGKIAEKEYILSSNWMNCSFEYIPSRKKDIGCAVLVFNFEPGINGKLNVNLDDVKAVAPCRQTEMSKSFLTIPKLSNRPVIDGKISENEWAGAIPLSGFTVANVLMPPKGFQTAWLGYDHEALYIAFKANDEEAPVASQRSRDSGTWRDDSVEILLASLDGKERAHFILNAVGSIFDSNYKTKDHNKWNPEWLHAVKTTSTGWQAEIAIPWNILEWKVNPGEKLRINIGQNDVSGDKNHRISNLNNWTIVRKPGSEDATFNLPELYPVACLDKNGLAAGAELNYNPRTFVPILKLNVTKSFKKPVKVICSYGTDRYLSGRINIDCSKNRTISRIPTDLFGNTNLGFVDVKAFDDKDKLIYAHREVFRVGFSSAVKLNNVFPKNYVELEVKIPSLQNFQTVYEIYAMNSQQVIKKAIPCKTGTSKIRVDVSKLLRGQPYNLLVQIQDQSGNTLSQKKFKLTRPALEPWRGNKVGITDKPLPPYIPIKITGNSFKCLMQEYNYGKNVLPVSIKSDGHELLAAPIKLKLSSSDGQADLAAAPLTVSSQKPNRIEWKAKNSLKGISAAWQCWMEEDGFAWYTVTLKTQKPIRVDLLELSVPVKKDYAKLISPLPFGYFEPKDTEGNWILKPEGWKAIEHKQILSVMNDDRGLELSSEDTRNWSNKIANRGQSISVKPRYAEILYKFIDKPIMLDGQLSFSFGIQAFPSKRAVHNPKTRYLASNFKNYPLVALAGDPEKAYVKYPLRENLDLKEGTLEAWIYAGFDPQFSYPYLGKYMSYFAQKFFKLQIGKQKVSLNWDHRRKGWTFSNDKIKIHGQHNSWKTPGWHHVAISWGDYIRVFDDGKLIAQKKADGLFSGTHFAKGDEDKGSFSFGKDNVYAYSAFNIGALRISSKALPVSEMALKGDFSKTDATLLLEKFSQEKADGENTSPLAGSKGVCIGNSGLHNFEGKQVLTLGQLFPKSRLDIVAEAGYKTLLSLNGFTERATMPYFETESRKETYKTYVRECHKRGIGVLPGFSFGIGWGSREENLYGYYWHQYPVHLCGLPNHPSGIKTFCVGVPLVEDFYCYYWDKFIKEFNVDGLYTDNTFVAGIKCQNQLHGCGWKDKNGKLHSTGNLLAGRRFIKRAYAVCKLRERPIYHYAHTSAGSHAIFASWIDQYLAGEQYRAHRNQKGWNIDLAQYRVQNACQRFGIESHVVAEMVPFGHEGVIALGLLHNVTNIDVVWRNWPNRLWENARPWKVMDKFSTESAEFLPYWNNKEYVTSQQDKRQYVTLWSHKGKNALAVIANLEWKKANVVMQFDLKKLGLKGQAKDAYSGEKIPMRNGKVNIPIGDYKMKLLWIE